MVGYYNSILINPSPISIKATGDQGAAADVHRRGQIVATIISIRLTGPAWQGYFHRIVVGAADTASGCGQEKISPGYSFQPQSPKTTDTLPHGDGVSVQFTRCPLCPQAKLSSAVP